MRRRCRHFWDDRVCLLERGYGVTIHENKAIVGGNLAGFEEGGVLYDVYPHLFRDWYHTFWLGTESYWRRRE